MVKQVRHLTRVSSVKLGAGENDLKRFIHINNMMQRMYLAYPLSYLLEIQSLDASVDIHSHLSQLMLSRKVSVEQLQQEQAQQ